MTQPIKRALLSLSDKTGAVEFAQFLATCGVEILSTGGTAKLLAQAGVAVKEVSEHTGFPEMLDGRVKTLHPKIHGGLLGRRDVGDHAAAMAKHGIAPIDLVAITLYPFEETVRSGADFDACVEQIDIGGPAMVRSAAKNHAHVTVITDPADYAWVRAEMEAHGGATTIELRQRLAAKAFSRTAAYDAAICTWFAGQMGETFPERMVVAATRKQTLAYGENPHQRAAFYAAGEGSATIAAARQLQGKELSYNNINDTNSAWELVCEFREPAVAIIKHANPCGVAVAEDLKTAYLAALACDPQSAYGGIVAVNRALDAAAAAEIAKLFVEVVIAPEFSPEALAMLAKKQKLRLLATGGLLDSRREGTVITSVGGGLLAQTRDHVIFDEATVKVVTKRQPSAQEMIDMRLALTIAKHVKSNAVVLARDGRSIGIGPGQTSRVESVRIACHKAAEAGLETKDCALASEAFFPFDDNVHLAAKAGITSIIQPGGSIRDEDVIRAADSHGMAMVFTGIRHFRH